MRDHRGDNREVAGGEAPALVGNSGLRVSGDQYMLANVTRDLALVPARRPSMEAFQRWLDAAADALVGGRPERGARRRRKRAATGHALAFETWRSLVSHQGMSRSEAIELMKALAAAAGRA